MIGTIIQVSVSRGGIPKLAIQAAMYDARVHARDHDAPRWGLSGFYAAVVQSGDVHPGDAIALV